MAETDGHQEWMSQREQRPPAAADQVQSDAVGPTNPLLVAQQTVGNQAVQRQLRGGALSPRVILGQQQTLGNQAVQRMLRSARSRPAPATGGPASRQPM